MNTVVLQQNYKKICLLAILLFYPIFSPRFMFEFPFTHNFFVSLNETLYANSFCILETKNFPIIKIYIKYAINFNIF